MTHSELVLVLDYGAQYSQLIARRIRELGVYSELLPYNIPIEKVKSLSPRGIILSGSPHSVYDEGAPISSPELFTLGVPILGICYGLQLIAHQLGGEVDGAAKREYGQADLSIDDRSDLFRGVGENGSSRTEVWMSHGDHLTRLPPGFEPIAHTSNAPICAIRDPKRKIFGVQFHPEVVHTKQGKDILRNFLFTVCGCAGGWTSSTFIKDSIEEVRRVVGRGKVICALSGGVDSSVAAVLIHQAIGDQLSCVHINNGLMRKGESETVVNTFRDRFKINLEYLDATDVFLGELEDVVDPEKKRRIIARLFIEVFEAEAMHLGHVDFLAQGTL